MHVSRHLLVCMLEAKGVNIYTKKHLHTCMTMMGLNILYFGTEGVVPKKNTKPELTQLSLKVNNLELTFIHVHTFVLV
jgi:hypothetical protein